MGNSFVEATTDRIYSHWPNLDHTKAHCQIIFQDSEHASTCLSENLCEKPIIIIETLSSFAKIFKIPFCCFIDKISKFKLRVIIFVKNIIYIVVIYIYAYKSFYNPNLLMKSFPFSFSK